MRLRKPVPYSQANYCRESGYLSGQSGENCHEICISIPTPAFGNHKKSWPEAPSATSIDRLSIMQDSQKCALSVFGVAGEAQGGAKVQSQEAALERAAKVYGYMRSSGSGKARRRTFGIICI